MSLKTGWLEKRQSERKEVKWDVTYQSVGAEEAQEIRSQINSAHPPSQAAGAASTVVTHDVSQGGLSILSREAIPSGAHVLLYLHVPEVQPSLVILAGSVHSVPAGELGLFRSGLKILAADDMTLGRLLDAL